MWHLLLGLAVLLGATQLSLTKEKCGYPACVFQRVPNKHRMEKVFVYLGFRKLPDTFSAQCPRIIARAEQCSSLYQNCAQRVRNRFTNRYSDGAFVNYLMRLGTYVCENSQDYIGLKTCFTKRLQKAVHSCITGHQFDIPCLSTQFNETSSCTHSDNVVFHYHINNWVTLYPYYTEA